MNSSDYIRLPNHSADKRQMGGKAAALANLSKHFNIPRWFVVTPSAFTASLSDEQKNQLRLGKVPSRIEIADDVERAVQDALKELLPSPQVKLAVRSSATAEDGANASFAGQLESYLNVPSNEVSKYVVEVWKSAFAEHVGRYRGSFANDAEWIPAVLVQHMVNARVAGVAFSADPVSGDTEQCIINATEGLADKLVSGQVNGDTYRLDKTGRVTEQTPAGEQALLGKSELQEILKLAKSVAQHFACPQDVEWAIEGETLYLLQARPITGLRLGQLSGADATLWDNSNIVESYSGVTSVLTFSFARYVYEHVYIEFCKLMLVPKPKIERESNAFRNMLGYVSGHVYYNLLNWYRVLALFPGFKMNRTFMEQMMGVKAPLPEEMMKRIVPEQPNRLERLVDGLRLTKTLFGLVRQKIKLNRTVEQFHRRLNEALSHTERLDGLPLSRLGQEYRNLESALLKRWDAPLINDFLCMIAFGLSRKSLEKHMGTDGLTLHNDIMIGQGNIVSAEPVLRIRRMAELVKPHRRLVEKLINGDGEAIDELPELKAEYDAYIAKFGDRCIQELKLESPTLHEDPTLVLQAIGHMANRELSADANDEDIDIVQHLAKRMPGKPLRRWFLGKVLLWAKARVRDRENLRFERTRVFGRARNIILEMGKRLVDLQCIEHPKDVFYFEINELMGLVEGTGTIADPAELVRLRKDQQLRYEANPPPPNRFYTRGASHPAFIEKRMEVPGQRNDASGGGMKGIGCCQGLIKAPVRVIADPRNAELLPGEIMVAEFTDPGWITLFANVSGIIVERGSLLSHSAIVAREMGIPAVVAVDGVMQWLKTGDIVEMDGTTGAVNKMTEADNENK